MPYYPEGSLENLKDKIKSGLKFSSIKLLDLILQIANGIYYLHNLTSPIYHRDLKPANVLIDKIDDSYTAIITDFWLSDILHKEFCINTDVNLLYQPKEVISETNEYVDLASADVYSFGLILYEILTLTKPYEYFGNNTAAIIKAIKSGEQLTSPKFSEFIRDKDNIKFQLMKMYEWCCVTESTKRPHMKSVVINLKHLKDNPEEKMPSFEKYTFPWN